MTQGEGRPAASDARRIVALANWVMNTSRTLALHDSALRGRRADDADVVVTRRWTRSQAADD
jgi:hypothetical protein